MKAFVSLLCETKNSTHICEYSIILQFITHILHHFLFLLGYFQHVHYQQVHYSYNMLSPSSPKYVLPSSKYYTFILVCYLKLVQTKLPFTITSFQSQCIPVMFFFVCFVLVSTQRWQRTEPISLEIDAFDVCLPKRFVIFFYSVLSCSIINVFQYVLIHIQNMIIN